MRGEGNPPQRKRKRHPAESLSPNQLKKIGFERGSTYTKKPPLCRMQNLNCIENKCLIGFGKHGVYLNENKKLRYTGLNKDFIPSVVFGKAAEASAQYLKKGKLAAVDGHLQIDSYENNQGQRVRTPKVYAETV